MLAWCPLCGQKEHLFIADSNYANSILGLCDQSNSRASKLKRILNKSPEREKNVLQPQSISGRVNTIK